VIYLQCILTPEFLCRLRATSFSILPSYSFIGHYKSRPNWPSSCVRVVTVKDSAAHCNVIFIPPICSDCICLWLFWFVGYHQFSLSFLGLHVVVFGFVKFAGYGCFECSSCGGRSVVCGSDIIVVRPCIFS
jgi:hypothetical protein